MHNVRGHVGQVDMAFLGMECAGAPLTWLYQGLLTKPVTKKMSDSRTLSGANAEQAAGIMRELGASEAYVYAMGEESGWGMSWPLPTTTTPTSSSRSRSS